MDQQQRETAATELKAAMDRLGWSNATLAAESGVSKNTVGSVLNGNPAQPGTLRKLRETLGIQPRVTEDVVFDADVETTALAVRTYLARLPREDRAEAIAGLIDCIVQSAVNRLATQPNG